MLIYFRISFMYTINPTFPDRENLPNIQENIQVQVVLVLLKMFAIYCTKYNTFPFHPLRVKR